MDGLYHPFIVILEITYSWAYQITIFQTNQHQHLGNSALRHVAVWESSLLIASQQDVCHQRKTRQGNDYVQMWVNAHLLQWKMLKHLWNWFSWLSIIIHPKGSAAQSQKNQIRPEILPRFHHCSSKWNNKGWQPLKKAGDQRRIPKNSTTWIQVCHRVASPGHTKAPLPFWQPSNPLHLKQRIRSW